MFKSMNLQGKVKMEKYYVEIPEDTIKALGIPKQEVSSTIKKELAVYLFEKACYLLVRPEDCLDYLYGIF